MAQAKPANRTFWMLFIGGVSIVGAYFYLQEDDTPKRVTKKRVVASSTKKADEFLPIDYKAKYASYTEEAKDAFKPLVLRSSDAGRSVMDTPGDIPLALTGGEPNWRYTGVAEIDGVPNALLDNSGTGEGVFLKAGERWKKATVLTVTRDSVVLQGEDGVAKEIRLADFGGKDDDENSKDAPVKPPISGAIGGLSVNPVPGGGAVPGVGSGGIDIGN